MTDEITMSEFDLREQRHRHDIELREVDAKWRIDQAKYGHKEARQETIKVVGLAAVGAALVLGIAGMIWQSTTGPDEDAAREQQREEACIAKGGGWVPESLLATSNVGICVYPGERAE